MKNVLHIDSDGTKYWYLNGKNHRKNGPAIERPDGTREYYLNGKLITLKTRSNDPKVQELQNYMKTQELIEA